MAKKSTANKTASKFEIEILETLKDIKFDIRILKADLKLTKFDIKDIKKAQDSLRNEVLNIGESLEKVKGKLDKIGNTLDGFVGRVDNLTIDNEVGADQTADHEKRISKLESSAN
jgi:hypothetical protein